MPGVVLTQRIDRYRVVIETSVRPDSVTNWRIAQKEAIHAQGQVWCIKVVARIEGSFAAVSRYAKTCYQVIGLIAKPTSLNGKVAGIPS